MTNTEIVDEALAKRAATYTNAMIRFGERNQMIVAVEELSECQKEICKILQGGKRKKRSMGQAEWPDLQRR